MKERRNKACVCFSFRTGQKERIWRGLGYYALDGSTEVVRVKVRGTMVIRRGLHAMALAIMMKEKKKMRMKEKRQKKESKKKKSKKK